MKVKRVVGRIFVYLFLIIAFVVSVFPFYWMITGMTNTAVDVIKGKMTFGSHLIDNFKVLFTTYNIKRIFFNSIKISVLTTVGTLIISSMAAYGFEVYSSKAREKTYAAIMLSMMVPFAALMIPLFKLIVKFHLINTHAGLILTSLASVFIIFFFRQSFKSFPKDIIQAARVDGAGEFKIFTSIVMPSMKSTYAAAAIYAFMTSWNSYLWPLIVLQTDKQKTMTLLISSMSSAYFPEYGVIMAAIVLATLPMIIIFFTLQNYFVQGMTGSIKQ
ncbi:lactose/L-arabinose transport system permease protein [Caloramator quimbayensis]|uniref:Lactose/L-arabinose transport system permease protein n=1 Tax=Caloramator quimbayensis TaxID=1147123 RepID=A0A1T4WR33_9CLOT|nr:carbohydrate ABC transporter permease [Caloramator quimbayensis]SKA79814.1 lactose/L-arabinose transport system permease protein [Caloramator quimbayensis]